MGNKTSKARTAVEAPPTPKEVPQPVVSEPLISEPPQWVEPTVEVRFADGPTLIHPEILSLLQSSVQAILSNISSSEKLANFELQESHVLLSIIAGLWATFGVINYRKYRNSQSEISKLMQLCSIDNLEQIIEKDGKDVRSLETLYTKAQLKFYDIECLIRAESRLSFQFLSEMVTQIYNLVQCLLHELADAKSRNLAYRRKLKLRDAQNRRRNQSYADSDNSDADEAQNDAWEERFEHIETYLQKCESQMETLTAPEKIDDKRDSKSKAVVDEIRSTPAHEYWPSEQVLAQHQMSQQLIQPLHDGGMGVENEEFKDWDEDTEGGLSQSIVAGFNALPIDTIDLDAVSRYRQRHRVESIRFEMAQAEDTKKRNEFWLKIAMYGSVSAMGSYWIWRHYLRSVINRDNPIYISCRQWITNLRQSQSNMNASET